MRMSPISSYSCMLGPQPLKVLGGLAMLEKINNQG